MIRRCVTRAAVSPSERENGPRTGASTVLEMTNNDVSGLAVTQEHEVFPVTSSVVSASEVLEEVTHRYRLVQPTTCRLLRRGLHDTYLITAFGERYVARLYRTGSRSSSDVGYELDFLTHLARKGVSVSRPVPDGDGRSMQLLSAPEGPRLFVIFTYASGARVRWDEMESRLAGRLLSEIHAASSDLVSAHARDGFDLEYLIDRPMASLRPFMSHRRNDWTYLSALVERIRARLAGLASDLDWGVCHGDFGAKNIHIDQGRRLTAFDFDRCGPGWRAFDFALILWAASGRKRPEMWRAFLAGYLERRNLSAADLAAMPLFHALARLGSLGLLATHANAWGKLRVDDTNLDGSLAFFRKWDAEYSAPGGSVQG
jgi:Ser/Thr protein kinase RdoA (MazF antagonist)